MRCFYHPQVEAVGICRNCQKGLCAECVTDLGNGIACKGKCEREVSEIIAMIRQNSNAYEQASRAEFQSAAFWIIVGCVSLLAHVMSTSGETFLFFGIVFLVLAGWNLKAGFKYKKTSEVSKT